MMIATVMMIMMMVVVMIINDDDNDNNDDDDDDEKIEKWGPCSYLDIKLYTYLSVIFSSIQMDVFIFSLLFTVSSNLIIS